MKRNPVLYLKELGFEIVKELGSGHFGRCYHVKEGVVDYTAKTINPEFTSVFAHDYAQHTIQYKQKVEHLLKEVRILRALGNVDGVQGLMTYFQMVQGVGTALRNLFFSNGLCPDQDIALIKQYIPGVPLEKGERIKGSCARLLEETVSEIHARGIAGFGLETENIILDDNGRIPYIIDLGHAEVFKDTSSTRFKRAAMSDLDDLKTVINYSYGK